MSATIEITVSPRGETQLATHGFTGEACREASRTLEAALGRRVNEQLTPEFYETTEQQQPLTERRGD